MRRGEGDECDGSGMRGTEARCNEVWDKVGKREAETEVRIAVASGSSTIGWQLQMLESVRIVSRWCLELPNNECIPERFRDLSFRF